MSPRISLLSAATALVAVASAATSTYQSASKSTASKSTASKSTASKTQKDPCAQIASLFAAQTFTFSSELGLACLNAMPFKPDLATSFIDELSKYLEWQSTLEILRNPPPGSLSATVDLVAGMSGIRNRASSNLYQSQYEFDQDINRLWGFANDGHLFLQSCSFNIIIWINPAPLVSLSIDGITIPQLYTLSDGQLLAAGNKDVSPVTLINGVGAESYIEQLAETQGFQDPDARYNAMLANVPITRQGTSGNTGGFSSFQSFPGVHEFNLTYANGTQKTYPLTAGISAGFGQNFTFTSGDALWEDACDPKNAPKGGSSSSKKVKRETKTLPAPATYPTPVIQDANNLLVGYFPTDPALKDVAVLTVPTFETSSDDLPDNSVITFALEAQKFVLKALKAGKEKIIIDVTGNPGGLVDSGFALISIFFPNMTIFSATRYRSVPATQYVFEAVTRGGAAIVNDPNQQDLIGTFYLKSLVEPDQKSTFASADDFIGPFYATNVPSTAIVAENNFHQTNATDDPINIFGLGGQLNGTEPPFRPENIAILTDGQCSSTCTIFINHMIPYGVRVVSVGGRPHNGPMQAIGGVKGSQTLLLSDISGYYDTVNELVKNATNAKKPLFTDKELSVYKSAIPKPLTELPIRVKDGQVNFRNAYAPFNFDLPTQFIYQAADCRLFYTPKSLPQPETVWVNTADAIWNGGGDCVFTTAPRKPLIDINGPSNTTSSKSTSTSKPTPTSTSAPSSATKGSGSKKSQGAAHKALGLLLAMAEGLKPQ